MHLGHALCDESLLDNDIKSIAEDPNARWLGGGDMCEFIVRSDKRHRESEIASWLHGEDDIVAVQEKRLVDKLAPIYDKCLGLVKGNHEDDILAKYERDVYSSIVNRITTLDRRVRLGAGGFVVIMWNANKKWRWSTTFFVHHGSGGGLLPGGHALTLGRLPTWYEFDIALLGHRHVKQWVPNTKMALGHKGNTIEKSEQHMLFGGTYLDSVCGDGESYAERKLLPPKGVGCVSIRICPSRKEYKIIL